MGKGFLEVSHMVFAQQKRKYTWQTTQIHETTEQNKPPEILETLDTLDTLDTPETPEKSIG